MAMAMSTEAVPRSGWMMMRIAGSPTIIRPPRNRG